MAVKDHRKPSFKPSKSQYWFLVTSFVLFGVVAGAYAGMQPMNAWRFFSWHPFLMTLGAVTLPGIAAVTKKMNGYTNTKLHGISNWLGIMCMGAGYYIIWKNKENNGAPHLTTNHGLVGMFVLLSMVGIGMMGGVLLHPDFGLDKQNPTIRTVHKYAGRVLLTTAWFTTILGLYTLIPNDYIKLMAYAAPLVCMLPYSLM
eukprot:CAMPEP_0198139248 /NCGR_PEP_ID=MMETSP1443-20131203/2599_1 /TAXON_ID=186043 /ORGANISM="Entomoneis sp., Strain CCMP2396" /LENGTH=199 /DNA_ID=CAMNT_0043801329 /DNA_START=67 /DNA_END=666 /DNA_ORIENTATION=-